MTSPDLNEAQAEATPGQRMLKSMSLRFLLSQADPYPMVLKQFIQFCLILIWPAWVFTVLLSGALYYTVYAVLWVLFWPLRAWMKKNRPDEYAASQTKSV